jgi:hypothetical protein
LLLFSPLFDLCSTFVWRESWGARLPHMHVG